MFTKRIQISEKISENEKLRCSKCLMLDSFPGITLDDEGICNHCRAFIKKEPLGEELLLKTLRSKRGDKYDCVIGISGGKDSCYVAYLASEKFKLRALAVFYDSPFYCDLARENVKNVCKTLNIDLKIVSSKNNLEYNLLRNHFISVGSTGTSWGQCFFCHYGIEAILFNIAYENKIPFSLSGSTQYESWKLEDRKKILLDRVKKLPIKDIINFIYYQSKAYFLLLDQRKQFSMPCNNRFNVYSRPQNTLNEPLTVKVFDYVRWDQNQIEKTLMEKTGWVRPNNLLSWGYDCSLEPFLDYTYKKEFGISTVGIYLSHLIRDGLMKRDEAFKILVKSESEEGLRKKLETVFEYLEIPLSIRRKFYEAK